MYDFDMIYYYGYNKFESFQFMRLSKVGLKELNNFGEIS